MSSEIAVKEPKRYAMSTLLAVSWTVFILTFTVTSWITSSMHRQKLIDMGISRYDSKTGEYIQDSTVLSDEYSIHIMRKNPR